MWVSQTFDEETSSAAEINMMILHNFYFPTTGLLLEPFLSDICLCYNDTHCRNYSSIAIVNREKYQIINVRAGGSKHVTNFETGSDGKSHKAMIEDLIK